jgi:5-methylcytosine-specific restriction endonuclease McrA
LNQGLGRDKVAEARVSQPLPQTHPALPRETNTQTKCGSKTSKAPTPPTTQTRTQAQAQALPLRRPLSASEKHAVFLRDQGRCTFMNERGERCNADRWLHVHHIKPVSQGGTNDLANLTVICSAHHDLVHQLSFALESQINWLREPTVAYVA